MFYPARVSIGKTIIKNADHGSNFVIGQNVIVNRTSNPKKNQGFGQQNADKVCTGIPLGVVWDDDQEDNWSWKNNI